MIAKEGCEGQGQYCRNTVLLPLFPSVILDRFKRFLPINGLLEFLARFLCTFFPGLALLHVPLLSGWIVFLFRTSSYQRRGILSLFSLPFFERISPTQWDAIYCLSPRHPVYSF